MIQGSRADTWKEEQRGFHRARSAGAKENSLSKLKLFKNAPCGDVVELKAAKTHTVLYQINRTEYYCQVDLPLSDYPLYGKQLVASRG